MKYSNSIRFKAFFLLLVFSLNTVIGFACAMGFNMGPGGSHHNVEGLKPAIHIHADGKKHYHQQEPVNAPVHVHADGKKHLHKNKAVKTSVHVHADGKKHEHESETANSQGVEKENPGKNKDNCCNDEVVNFQQLDKSLNQHVKIAIASPVFLAILSIFSGIEILSLSAACPPQFKARLYYPPPPGLRIAIQRFQI